MILACAVMAISLFFLKSFASGTSEQTSAASLISGSEQRLKSQIGDLSSKISAFNGVVSQLQGQAKSAGTAAASAAEGQIQRQIDSANAETANLAGEVDSLGTQIAELQERLKSADPKNLASEIDALKAQVAELQSKLKVAETAIGNTPVTVNGLSILFITNNIDVGVTGPTAPNSAQFAVKIINNTPTALNNIDVTGTISSTLSLSDGLAPGYPQLIDGAGLCTYVFFIRQDTQMHFEAFGNGKSNLSIAQGGSITIRPKVSVLSAAKTQLPGMSLHIALETVTFDQAPGK